MKVAFINCKMTGSTGIITRHIAECLRENGHEAVFVTGHKEPKGIPYSYQTNKSPIVKAFSKIRAEFDGSDGFVNDIATKKAIKYLKSENVDLIHLHNTHDHFINTEMIVSFAKKNNIPVVWTLHDQWIVTGRCCYAGDCLLWKTRCGHCPNKSNYLRTRLFDRSAHFWKKKRSLVLKNGIRLISVSKWLANDVFEGSYGLLPEVFYNPVDLEVFSSTKPNDEMLRIANGRKIIFSCASELNIKKGLGALIKLSNELDQEKYVIFAAGVRQGSPDIGKIHPLGMTNDRQLLASYYAASDVFANFTLLDNIPTVNIEALASGTPVVTYRAGGSAEMIDEGKNGYSVPLGDYEGAKEKILAILGDSQISRDTCRSTVRKFDKKEASMRYLDLYKEILGL